MRALRVVADDLTGACDIGGELLGLGRPVLVRSVVGPVGRPSDEDALWVHNTQSRGVTAPEASRRVQSAFTRAPLAAGEIAFKKIDTALRGHVAAELEAAADALGVGRIVVLPAIPDVGRTTEDGRQLLGGVPVSETAFGRDPLNPVLESDLQIVLASIPGFDVQHISLETLRDEPARRRAFADETPGRRRALVVDAVTNDDLERGVGAALASAAPVLLVGSIGAGRALGRALGATAPPAVDAASPAGGGILVVSGSAHPAATAQISSLTEELGVPACEAGADARASGVLTAGILAASGLAVLVPGSGPVGHPGEPTRRLAETTAVIVEAQRPGTLILIGGETAYHCLQALGDVPLRVHGRPWPLVVAGQIHGGELGGTRVLTKGGSAGEKDALVRMVAMAMGDREDAAR